MDIEDPKAVIKLAEVLESVRDQLRELAPILSNSAQGQEHRDELTCICSELSVQSRTFRTTIRGLDEQRSSGESPSFAELPGNFHEIFRDGLTAIKRSSYTLQDCVKLVHFGSNSVGEVPTSRFRKLDNPTKPLRTCSKDLIMEAMKTIKANNLILRIMTLNASANPRVVVWYKNIAKGVVEEQRIEITDFLRQIQLSLDARKTTFVFSSRDEGYENSENSQFTTCPTLVIRGNDPSGQDRIVRDVMDNIRGLLNLISLKDDGSSSKTSDCLEPEGELVLQARTLSDVASDENYRKIENTEQLKPDVVFSDREGKTRTSRAVLDTGCEGGNCIEAGLIKELKKEDLIDTTSERPAIWTGNGLQVKIKGIIELEWRLARGLRWWKTKFYVFEDLSRHGLQVILGEEWCRDEAVFLMNAQFFRVLFSNRRINQRDKDETKRAREEWRRDKEVIATERASKKESEVQAREQPQPKKPDEQTSKVKGT